MSSATPSFAAAMKSPGLLLNSRCRKELRSIAATTKQETHRTRLRLFGRATMCKRICTKSLRIDSLRDSRPFSPPKKWVLEARTDAFRQVGLLPVIGKRFDWLFPQIGFSSTSLAADPTELHCRFYAAQRELRRRASLVFGPAEPWAGRRCR